MAIFGWPFLCDSIVTLIDRNHRIYYNETYAFEGGIV